MSNSKEEYESYPPFFRQNQSVDHQQQLIITPKSSSQSIPEPDSLPVIDFQLINPEKLGEICRTWGMFRLVNHGVPIDLLNQLHEHADRLFSLKFESKLSLLTNPILYFYGTPALTMSGNAQQTGSGPENINWLEGLNIPLVKSSHFHYDDPFLESFRSLLEEYGRHQARLAKTLFEVMAKDLNFSPTKKKSYFSSPTGFLRVYRYFRCPMPEQRWGINVHTDSSVLSILHQDEVGGLQVYRNSKWLDVEPVHDSFIVNLGDMMQAMSDDCYVSVKHRVKVNKEKERISMGYFVFPEEDAVIESSKYKPFTYTDFQAAKELDLKNVGIKIGLPRFRINKNMNCYE